MAGKIATQRVRPNPAATGRALRSLDRDGLVHTLTRSSEVVRYMVARVDKALKDDLGISEGLAAENVYVLDPCCGTGAYLAEVLRRIALNLEARASERSRAWR